MASFGCERGRGALQCAESRMSTVDMTLMAYSMTSLDCLVVEDEVFQTDRSNSMQ